jgi:hypothetical protein
MACREIGMSGPGIAGRVVRRIAHRLVRGTVRRARLIVLGVTALGAVGIAGAAGALDSLSLPAALPIPGVSAGYRAVDGEPAATSQYVHGQENFDASMMWAAFSDKTLAALQQGGGSPSATQRQLDSARTAGVKIVSAQYVGATAIPNGSMHFYVIGRTDGPGQAVRYVPYTFTLDAAGKIDRVD